MTKQTNLSVFSKALRLLISIILLTTTLSVPIIYNENSYANQDDVVELDPQLRKEILGLIGRSYESIEPITVGDMQTITQTLRIEGGEVASLEGLQYATSLTTIQIISTALTDITPISNLSNLKQLSVYAPLESFPSLAGLTGLEEFVMSGTQITDISAFGELPSNTRIVFSGSPIKKISDPSKLKNVKYLDLSYNRIDDISNFVGLTSLEELDLGMNNITDISMLADMPNLKKLNLQNNSISEFNISDTLPKLEEMDLSYNNITKITLDNDHPNLSSINLSHNEIVEFKSAAAIPSLNKLNLEHNNISIIPDCMMQNLKGLYLSSNNLSDLKFLKNYPNLEEFNAYSNSITDISPIIDIDTLRAVYLSGNQIYDLSPLLEYDGQNLEFIELQDNRITEIGFLFGKSLGYKIDLAHNNIDIADKTNYDALLSWYDSTIYEIFLKETFFKKMELHIGEEVKDITQDLNWYRIEVPSDEEKIRFSGEFLEAITLVSLNRIEKDMSEKSVELIGDGITFEIELDPEKDTETFTYEVVTYLTRDDGLSPPYRLSNKKQYITIVITKLKPVSIHSSQPVNSITDDVKGLLGMDTLQMVLIATAFIFVTLSLYLVFRKRNSK